MPEGINSELLVNLIIYFILNLFNLIVYHGYLIIMQY